jgi:hypothetical protein
MTLAHSDLALRIGAAIAIGLVMLASIGAAPARSQDYAAIIAQADRTEADRVTDKRRDSGRPLDLHRTEGGLDRTRYGCGRRLQHRTHGPFGRHELQGIRTG